MQQGLLTLLNRRVDAGDHSAHPWSGARPADTFDADIAKVSAIAPGLRANGNLPPRRGRRSQLNFQLAEYHGMIGEGYPVLRGRRSS